MTLDRGVRRLIRCLNDYGIRTVASCAGHRLYGKAGRKVYRGQAEQGFVSLSLRGHACQISHDAQGRPEALTIRWTLPKRYRGGNKMTVRRTGTYSYAAFEEKPRKPEAS